MYTVAGKSSIFPQLISPGSARWAEKCIQLRGNHRFSQEAAGNGRAHAHSKADNSALFRPFYVIFRQDLAKFRRATFEIDENAAARQISVVFDVFVLKSS